MEFLARLLSCPSKVIIVLIIRIILLVLFFQLAFVRKFMNIVDFLAILPYFVSLAFYRLVMPWHMRGRVETQSFKLIGMNLFV